MSIFSVINFRRASIFTLLFTLLLLTASSALGQRTLSGTWKAKVKHENSEKIHISFRSNSSENHNHHTGTDFNRKDLIGLSDTQINGSDTSVNFRVNREAGSIKLAGKFDNGIGKGTWTFTPDAQFVSKISGYDFNDVSTKKLFTATILNVRSKTISDLSSAGLKLKFDDVIAATIFKIDSKYIKEMNSVGFKNLEMDHLVQGKIFKINAQYAKKMLAVGFGKNTLSQLVQFKIFKVTPEFLSSIKTLGLSNLTASQVVQLRIFKIDSEFIKNAKARGYKNPSVEDLVQLKIHGNVNL